MGAQKCIICLNFINLKKKLVAQHSLEDQMLMLYFLRKLAWTSLPDKDLQTFLNLGNPSEWAGLCYICEGEVKRCLEMHREVAKILSQITDIRKKLYEDFFEVEGEDEVELNPPPPPIKSRLGAEDMFIQLRHRLFSDFKKSGQETRAFDKTVGISYRDADMSNARKAKPTTKVTAAPRMEETVIYVKKENLVEEGLDEAQDYSESFADDWDTYEAANEVDISDSVGRHHWRSIEARGCSSSSRVPNLGPLKEEPSSSSTQDTIDPAPASLKQGKTARPTQKLGNSSNISRKKRRQYDWELVRSFGSLEEAKSHVKGEKWRLRCNYDSIEGRKISYDCSHGRHCPAKIYLFVREERHSQVSVELYATNLAHDHDHEVVKKQGLTQPEKSRINQLYASGVRRPKRILNMLKKEGMLLSKSKVNAYIQYNIRRKELGPVDPSRPKWKCRGRPPKHLQQQRKQLTDEKPVISDDHGMVH